MSADRWRRLLGSVRASLWQGHGGVLLLFALLAWLVAFGSGAHLLTHSYGGDLQSADAPTFLFYFWHLKQAVLGRAELFYSDRLFYPLGMEMIRQNWAPVVGLMALPFQPLGPLAAYNLQYWLAYTLCGFATYLLAHHLCRNRAYALFAGLAFAFCEFRVLKVHHFGLPPMAHQEFIPLYALLAVRFFDEKRLRLALGAGVCFFLATFTSPYQMVFLLLLTVLLWLWHIGRVVAFPGADSRRAGLARTARQWSLFAAVGGGAALLLAIPVVANNWQAFLDGAGALGPVSTLPTDLLSYLVPHKPQASALLEETKGVYLGYSLLAAVGVGGVLCLRRATGAAFWLFAGAVFFLFSLGVSLTVAGERLFELPFFPALAEIPLIRGARTPGRFASVTVLCLAVTAALFFARLERDRLAGRTARWAMRALLLLAVLGELWSLRLLNTWQPGAGGHKPLPVSRAYTTLAADRDDASLLVTPMVWEAATGRLGPHFYPREFFYLQTIHGKRLLTGMGDAVPPGTLSYFENLPFVGDLSRLERGAFLPPPTPDKRKEAIDLTRFLGIRHILVNLKNLGGASRNASRALLTQLEILLPLRRVAEDRSMILLQVVDPKGRRARVQRDIRFDPTASRVHLGVGWSRQQRNNRWLAEAPLQTAGTANLYLRLPGGPAPLSVTLEQRCPGTPCRQTITVNGRPQTEVTVGTRWQPVRLRLFAHQRRAGINRIGLRFAAAPTQKTFDVGRTGVRTDQLIRVVSSADWASVGIGQKEVTPTERIDPRAVARDLKHTRRASKKLVPRTVIDGKPGVTVVAIQPQSGRVLGGDTFDLLGRPEEEAGRMEAVLSSIPPGSVVCVTLRSRRPLALPARLALALRQLGVSTGPGATVGPVWAVVGAKGAAAGSAVEATDPNEAVISLGGSVVRLRRILLQGS